MKQRIIAAILLLITVLLAFSGCANYAFAEEDNFGQYATIDEAAFGRLMDALHNIVIEDEDFGGTLEERKELVEEETYNSILTALSKDSKNEITDGEIGEKDMVKYHYYCSVVIDGKTYKFNYNMTSTTTTLTTSSMTDEQKEIKNKIAEALVGKVLVKDGNYEITTSLSNEKVHLEDGETLVVSYTLRTVENGIVKFNNYANVEIDDTHELYTALVAGNAVMGGYKNPITIGDKTYSNIRVSHIVNNAGQTVEVKIENKEEQTVTAYENGKQVSLKIPASTEDAKVEITYHVVPVAFVKAPVADAKNIIKYVLGDDITTGSLTILGSEDYTFEYNGETKTLKALVEALKAEYAKTSADYADLGDVKAALKAYEDERTAARVQALKDVVNALEKATNSDGKTATAAIVEYYNGKNGTNLDIHGIFEALGKDVKYDDLLAGGAKELYNYTNKSGTTARSLVDAIRVEYAKDVTKDYDSYKYNKDDKKIDVSIKKGNYDNTVLMAQLKVVNDIVDTICSNADVAKAIVEQYKASKYNTVVTAYDLLKHVLLTSTSTESTFSFIDNLSNYLYGASTSLDEEDRETFASILKLLTAELGKSATTGYEGVLTVTAAREKLEDAQDKAEDNIAISEIAKQFKDNYSRKYTVTSGETETTKTEYAFYALLAKYRELHPETLYVESDAKDNEKLAGSNYTAVLQLILADTDNRDAYKAVLTANEFTYKVGEETKNASDVFAKAIKTYDDNKEIEKLEEAYADAQTEAQKVAVDNLIAKLLSGVLSETDEEHEEHKTVFGDHESYGNKLSVIIVERYIANTLASKISTYNSNVQDKLTKAIYNIINDDSIVKVTPYRLNEDGSYALDENGNKIQNKAYPWDVIEEFVEELESDYKYKYYTGTSDKTTAGTPATGVSAEQRAQYEYYTNMLNEASAAKSSGETGSKNALDLYVSIVILAGDIAAIEGINAEKTYTLTQLEADYYAAYKAQKAAAATATTAGDKHTDEKAKLKEAEKLLEEAKNASLDKSLGLIDRISKWFKDKKDAENRVEAAQAAVDTAKAALDAATKELNTKTDDLATAREKLADSFMASIKEEDGSLRSEFEFNFVDAKNSFNNAKNTDSTYYKAKAKYDTAKREYDNAVAKPETDAVIAEKKAAFITAAEEFSEKVLTATNSVKDKAVTYYQQSEVVIEKSADDYKAADVKLNGKKDGDGNVTEKGLIALMAEAEGYTLGKSISNREAYRTFDDYLVHVLGKNPYAVLEQQAVEQLNEQIRVYAVARMLVENGVVANGSTDYGIVGYKAAIEANADTFKNIYKHSFEHSNEDWSEKKLNKEVDKEFKKLIDSTGDVFVTKKVYNSYKNEIGRSQYTYMKNEHGDNNLRMSLQFSNLLTYLLFANYQVNPYAAHDGEYMLKVNGDKLEYFFIHYQFESEVENADK